jgi:hypothetical protein
MRILILSALAARFAMAFQLGPDLQPQIPSARQLTNDGSCASAFVDTIWPSAKDDNHSTQRLSLLQGPVKMATTLRMEGCTLPKDPAGKKTPTTLDLPVLIHGAVWQRNASTYTMISSEWEVYRIEKFTAAPAGGSADSEKVSFTLVQVSDRGTTNQTPWKLHPALYGAKAVLFIGISRFVDKNTGLDSTSGDGDIDLTLNYVINTAPATSDVVNGISLVAGALAPGLAQSAGGIGAKVEAAAPLAPTPKPYFYTCALIRGPRLPFDITLSLTAAEGKQSAAAASGSRPSTAGAPAPGAQNQGCSWLSANGQCSISSHTVRSYDKEFVDAGIGISIPGVLEPQYAPSNPAIPLSPARHTDLTGMLNFYPFAAIADKNSYFPSIAAGIPVTGKVFYRPYFGLAENFTGSRLFGWLPVPLNFFAGMMWMNQEVTRAVHPGALEITHSRVWKPAFGIELPVSALVSKIASLGTKSGSSPAQGGSAR